MKKKIQKNSFLFFLFLILKILGIFYYLSSLSYRLTFQFSSFSFSFLFLSTLFFDYFFDFIFLFDFLFFEIKIKQSFHIFPLEINENEEEIEKIENLSVSTDETDTTLGFFNQLKALFPSKKSLFSFISLFPLEILGYFIGFQYYPWLRLNRLLKTITLLKDWNSFLLLLEQNKFQINGCWSRLIFIFLLQLLFFHISGCIFYFLGFYSLLFKEGRGVVDNNWLTQTSNVIRNSNGKIQFLHTIGHLYLQSIYFSVQTLVIFFF